jgi:hypothetical protein
MIHSRIASKNASVYPPHLWSGVPRVHFARRSSSRSSKQIPLTKSNASARHTAAELYVFHTPHSSPAAEVEDLESLRTFTARRPAAR